MTAHTLVARTASLVKELVASVLRTRTYPKLTLAIVQTVMFSMVHHQARRRIHNLPVHLDCLPAVPPYGIVRRLTFYSTPFIFN